MPDTTIPPTTETVPPVVPPVDVPAPAGNDDNKFRRLHQAEEAKRIAAEAKVAELESLEKTRQQAEMSEVERVKAQAADLQAKAEKAEARTAELEREKLINAIAAENHLTSEARELLAGEDEAALRANALKLAAIMKQPAQAGTTTNPPSVNPASVSEQIAAAHRAGNMIEAIRLKRGQAFGLTQ